MTGMGNATLIPEPAAVRFPTTERDFQNSPTVTSLLRAAKTLRQGNVDAGASD